jgi:hypothetical protein
MRGAGEAKAVAASGAWAPHRAAWLTDPALDPPGEVLFSLERGARPMPNGAAKPLLPAFAPSGRAHKRRLEHDLAGDGRNEGRHWSPAIFVNVIGGVECRS